MKKQLRYITSVCALMLAMLQTSCSDNDGYSIGDIAYDWVTIHVESDGIYTFTGDTWGTITRGMLIFNPLFDDYYGYDVGIKPEQLRVFLTKTVEEINDDNKNEYADHPAYVRDAWIAGGYMNMLFDMKMPLNEKHRVSLVKRAGKPTVNDDGYIHLEYRYNTYGDTTDVFNPYTEVVCYNLNTLPLDEAKGIKMEVNHAVYGRQTLVFENKNEPTPDEAKNLSGPTEEERDIY